eukprot:1161266-Pelagomonas_calceolata.AAC.17
MLCYCWQLLQSGRSSKGCEQQQKEESPSPLNSMAVLHPSTKKRGGSGRGCTSCVSSGNTASTGKRTKTNESVGHLEGGGTKEEGGGEVTSSLLEAACKEDKEEQKQVMSHVWSSLGLPLCLSPA